MLVIAHSMEDPRSPFNEAVGDLTPDRFRRWLLVIVAVHLLTRLPFLGLVTLWNIDEGRIAEVSREMAITGDFVTPRIGGEPFASYPPFLYWLMAASGGLLGFNEFSMRLPGALAGAALVAVVALMGRRLAGGRAGLASAVVLATLPAFTSQEVICRGDVMMTLFSAIAFDRFLAFMEGDRRTLHAVAMYAALALAVLTKGPLGAILPGFGVLVWATLRGRWRDLFAVRLWAGLPVMLAAVLPWYVAVTFAAGAEFTRYNLMLENVNAFTSGFEHPKPPWALAGWASYRLIPWLLVLPLAWKVRRTPGLSIALGWTAAIFVLLTISSSKRSNYLTFLCPAFALSVGIALEALLREAPARGRRVPILIGVLVAAAGLAGMFLPLPWKGSFLLIQDLIRPVSLGLIATGGVVLAVTRWKGATAGAVALAAALAAGVPLQSAFVEPRLDEEGRRGVAFCREINALLPPGETVFIPSRRELEGSFHFYLGRIVTHRSDGAGFYLGVEGDERRFPPGKTRRLAEFVDERGRSRAFFEVRP